MLQLTEITYARGGDARATMRRAIKGHPVNVAGKASVYTLFHVLDRMPQAATHTMIFKETGADVWRVYVLPRDAITGNN